MSMVNWSFIGVTGHVVSRRNGVWLSSPIILFREFLLGVCLFRSVIYYWVMDD